MPSIHRQDGFRFFFFSNENEEPPHIHVEKAEGYAKFWLHPDIDLAWSKGFRKKDLAKISRIMSELQSRFLEEWDAYFEETN